MNIYKNQKGITLIALIITIIVMLILVSVTVNVALNGGLFEKAKEAGTQTQREADREMLLTETLGTIDNNGYLDISGLTISGWTKGTAKQDSNSKTYYEFTSSSGNKFYVYDRTGEIMDEEPTGGSTPNPEPNEFSWSDYGLNGVETGVTYLLDTGAAVYEMTFSNSGVYDLSEVGESTIDTFNVTNSSDITTYGITYTSNSLSYQSSVFGNVTLTLNDGDIDATINGGQAPDGTYTYVKQVNP